MLWQHHHCRPQVVGITKNHYFCDVEGTDVDGEALEEPILLENILAAVQQPSMHDSEQYKSGSTVVAIQEVFGDEVR